MYLVAVFLVSVLSLGESLRDDIQAKKSEKIVNGMPAPVGKYPFTVALFRDYDYKCTASIISETSIMTAAHCVVVEGETMPPSDFYGLAGVSNRSSYNTYLHGTFLEFKSISVHPRYNEGDNDIAILETKAPIEFSRRLQKICIAEGACALSSKRVVVVGWGQTNRDTAHPDLPEVLQFTSQRVVPNLTCQLLYHGSPVPASVMCATGLRRGICSGDSGSPLVYQSGRQLVQVGIGSYSHNLTGCAHLFGPAAFTRVCSYTEYIKEAATGDVCVVKIADRCTRRNGSFRLCLIH